MKKCDTLDRMVATVADHGRGASEFAMEFGLDWYPKMAPADVRRLMRECGLTYRQGAGMIAAYNSNQAYPVGVAQAEKMGKMKAAGRKRQPAIGLPDSCGKAWAIANGARPLDVLGGGKIRSFYRNLCGDADAVTIDRWAERATGCTPGLKYRAGGYTLCEEAYRMAADDIGWAPADLQAVVWVSIRGDKIT